jgi:endoglucanase
MKAPLITLFLSPARQRTMFIGGACVALMACGGMTLYAQNTSPLDTAPGVPVATSTNPPPAAPTPSPAVPTDSGPSLLSNSNFELATKDPTWPDDWGKADGISWESESNFHFLRLVQQQPGKMLMAYREMNIPEGVKGLKITIRYRTAGVVHGKTNWMDSRAIFHFIDVSRNVLAGDPPPMIFPAASGTWAEGSVNAVVPDGATELMLMPSLFMANAGTLDLANVRVEALDDPTVADMKMASETKAKREADRAAIIAQELALPSKSPELKVSGNKLVTADGNVVWLQGVNVVPLGWSPNGEGNIPWSIHVAIEDWHANVIRLPVMDTFWFGKAQGDQPANDPAVYRAIVDNAVKLAAVNGAYIVLDLHRFLTPDQGCIDFWKDAAARYKNNPAVLFDLFNEPHDTSWDVWQKGGPVVLKQKDGTSQTIQGVGMQALVDAVRGTGAKNIIVAGGLAYAYDLTGVLNGYALDDKGGNGIMYATHFYNWHSGWSAHFMAVAAKYPVFVGETGGDIKKMNFIPSEAQEDPYTWAPDAIGFFQKNHLNWTGWSFNNGASPSMLLNMDDFTPNPYWGQFVKDALGGKQFTMKKER